MSLPIPIRESADKLPVIDLQTNETLLWVDEHEARKLIREGRVSILRTKKKIRGLGWLAQTTHPSKPTAIRQRGTMGDSHHHERQDNPEGVWTIDRVGRNKRKLFLQVVADCTTPFREVRRAA